MKSLHRQRDHVKPMSFCFATHRWRREVEEGGGGGRCGREMEEGGGGGGGGRWIWEVYVLGVKGCTWRQDFVRQSV